MQHYVFAISFYYLFSVASVCRSSCISH